ncbi:MAG: hypothetical protein AAGA91_10220 [Pseudomonadota bacterium]
MTEPRESDDYLEEQLAARFVRLREQESAWAPPVPEATAIATTAALHRGGPRAWWAAAAAVAALAILLYPEPADDAGVLYQQVMSGSDLITDQMMLSSPATLPEQLSPDITFEIDIPQLN